MLVAVFKASAYKLSWCEHQIIFCAHEKLLDYFLLCMQYFTVQI